MGMVFHEMVLPFGHIPVSVTLVPVQVLNADEVMSGGKSGVTFTTKTLLVTTQGV